MNSVILISVLAVLILIILFRTAMCREIKHSVQPIDATMINPVPVAEHLSGAVRIKTIGYDEISLTDHSTFKELASYLKKTFPRVHKTLKCETVNKSSLLYHWKGSDPSLKPAVFCAHLDVVPVETGTEGDWKYPPFGGVIAEDSVWGRGALDIKIQVITLLEAAEFLIGINFTPRRDIYFAFGHDEETRRFDGADRIAALLKERGVSPEYVLDEGGCVTDAGINRPAALVGIAEKGFININLTAKGAGGHSAMPPVHTAAGSVCRAVAEIEKHPQPLFLTQPVRAMLTALAPHMPFVTKMIISNLWLFTPLFMKIFAKSQSGSAMLRTTCAATMLDGSKAPNVLPQQALAVVNARLLPGDSSSKLKKNLKKLINDRVVEVEMIHPYESSKVSPVKTFGFSIIENTIHALWPDAVVAPYLVTGGTDARKYEGLTENIYRFSPYKVNPDELKQMHGTNEHISFKNIQTSVAFYTELFSK
jgi:carboxypeptidase PM20D1